MRNTEILVLFEIDKNLYGNRIVNFKGTLKEAKIFATKKGFGGGIDIIKRSSLKKRGTK